MFTDDEVTTTAVPTTNDSPPSTASPDPVVTPAPSPPPVSTLPPGVYAPDGKRWEDKFHGASGALQQTKTQLQDHQTRIATLEGQLQERDGQITGYRTEVDGLNEQLAMIPELRDKIAALNTQAELGQRLELLLNYPELLAVRVEQQVEGEGEDEEPKTVTVNPLLELVKGSALPADQLTAEVERLATFLRGQQPDAPPPEPATPTPSVPSPATPVEETAAAAFERAMELQEELNSGDMTKYDEWREAWQKYMELKGKEELAAAQ